MIARCYLDEIDSTHPKTSLRQCLSQDLYIVPSAALVSKDAISKVGYFDERLSGYEDDDLFVRIFWAGYRNVYLKVAVSRWRHYGGSSSFSARMGQSRMIYFKKLADTFPDEPNLGLWWRHNIIGPRFMKIAFNEFIRASRAGDTPALDRAWSEIKEIAPVMNRRTRERVEAFLALDRAALSDSIHGVGPRFGALCRPALMGARLSSAHQNTARKIVLACISQPYTPRAWAKAASAIAS